MPTIHMGLSTWLLLFWSAVTAMGFLKGRLPIESIAADYSRWHQIAGLFVAVFTCLVHVIVMWHFLGSGKAMKEALQERGTGADKVQFIRRMKMKVYPWTTFAMVVPIAGAILGGAALNHYVPLPVHLGFVLLGFALNVAAVVIAQKWLRVNARLIREVEAMLVTRRE